MPDVTQEMGSSTRYLYTHTMYTCVHSRRLIADVRADTTFVGTLQQTETVRRGFCHGAVMTWNLTASVLSNLNCTALNWRLRCTGMKRY